MKIESYVLYVVVAVQKLVYIKLLPRKDLCRTESILLSSVHSLSVVILNYPFFNKSTVLSSKNTTNFHELFSPRSNLHFSYFDWLLFHVTLTRNTYVSYICNGVYPPCLPMCTLYTHVYPVYPVYPCIPCIPCVPCVPIYTLYTLCTLYTLYTLYTLCTLYTLYTLYTHVYPCIPCILAYGGCARGTNGGQNCTVLTSSNFIVD